VLDDKDSSAGGVVVCAEAEAEVVVVVVDRSQVQAAESTEEEVEVEVDGSASNVDVNVDVDDEALSSKSLLSSFTPREDVVISVSSEPSLPRVVVVGTLLTTMSVVATPAAAYVVVVAATVGAKVDATGNVDVSRVAADASTVVLICAINDVVDADPRVAANDDEVPNGDVVVVVSSAREVDNDSDAVAAAAIVDAVV